RPAEQPPRRAPDGARRSARQARRITRRRRARPVPDRGRSPHRHAGRRTPVDHHVPDPTRRARFRVGRRHRTAKGITPMTDSTSPTTSASRGPSTGTYAHGHKPRSPWPALWALVIGFFMILVDTTIVSVANPAIKAALDPDTNNLDNVVWVTSAYLLAYAVPLLITGRLGRS